MRIYAYPVSTMKMCRGPNLDPNLCLDDENALFPSACRFTHAFEIETGRTLLQYHPLPPTHTSPTPTPAPAPARRPHRARKPQM